MKRLLASIYKDPNCIFRRIEANLYFDALIDDFQKLNSFQKICNFKIFFRAASWLKASVAQFDAQGFLSFSPKFAQILSSFLDE